MRADARADALLEYIRESIDRIDEYTGGGHARPLPGTMAEDAVLRRLETLADAASRLSERLTARHRNIPWREVVGFRNVPAHGYIGVDPDLVWQVVTRDLPPLRSAVGGGVASKRFLAPNSVRQTECAKFTAVRRGNGR